MGISFDQILSVSMSNLVMFLFSVFYLYLGMGYLLVMSSSYSILHEIIGNIKKKKEIKLMSTDDWHPRDIAPGLQ